ncbi:MAG: hypothetical protein J3K34DRAFT_412581 [Monoraphidium minutum]|nr:MAG: hypothetical protein J3K34DRAFT_412581 [Monoraphidium minutum]
MQLCSRKALAGATPRLARPSQRATHWARPQTQQRATKDDDPGAADRSYEDLFKDEIARRGLSGGSVTSSREEAEPIAGTSTARGSNPFSPPPPPRGTIPGSRSRAPPPPVAGGADDAREGQRERSIAMVNEGLEGLIPRASQLLQLGGGVFLAFAPFMLAFSLLFTGIYFVFGDSFLHGGEVGRGLPAYIDADALLAEPTVDPRIPFN